MMLAETGACVATVTDRSIAGPAGPLALRDYTPVEAREGLLPAVVFLHGGGFVCGGLDPHDAFCRTLCVAIGCRLIAIDYRLAPEHPFPAAVDDAWAATTWVLDHAVALGLDPTRIAICGDSAGAGLAAVVCHRAGRSRPGALALQLLLCPILDWAEPACAGRDFSRSDLLSEATIARERAAYLSTGQDAARPDVSPLRTVDLVGQPPAQIHTAEFDPVRADGAMYAARLRATGIDVRHTCHAGMIHLFYALGRLVPTARSAVGQIGAEMRAAFA